MISPPTFSSLARASDITPLGVERMATPRPLATRLEVPDRRVDAPARRRDAADLLDRRLTVEILELDLELGLAALRLDPRVAADVALFGQHVENAGAHVRSGRRDLRPAAHLRIADARQHIADGIVHCHVARALSYQLDLTMPGIRP